VDLTDRLARVPQKIKYIIRFMSWLARRGRAGALAIALALGIAGCGGRFLGKVYEYDEDLYLSLDGSADVIINASIPALVILRGLDLNLDPAARVDTNKVRAAFQSPVAEIRGLSRPWRRRGRRFIQIRLHIDDVRKLSQVQPFAWSTYELAEREGQVVFRQTVGPSAHRPGTLQNVGWQGGELVAFRLHLPSRISWHNSRELETNETSDIARGNILAWEQLLADRLDGRPISIEVRMDRQSILYRTLWLFAGAFTSAVGLMALLIWLTVRKGAKSGA
jgi:hypothetical protein